ncbi:MAG: hypothetical protein HY717_14080 [Planctomycetes bacterium]|nr:hypothetical protein [Planctomycetota bacterium]
MAARPEAWEGSEGLPQNTCDATIYFGGVEDRDDIEHAYRFSAVWSSSAPVERIDE